MYRVFDRALHLFLHDEHSLLPLLAFFGDVNPAADAFIFATHHSLLPVLQKSRHATIGAKMIAGHRATIPLESHRNPSNSPEAIGGGRPDFHQTAEVARTSRKFKKNITNIQKKH